jgi:GrpB-like predicted nucleotidyltransferase (UPF0157 family)
VRFLGLDHVQVAAPPGSEREARRFYGELLGLAEIAKPESLAKRGGVWFAIGNEQLHIGVADPFVPAAKAHPALRVAPGSLEALADRLRLEGVAVRWDAELAGARRLHLHDPWGNRLEILEVRDEPVRVVPYDPAWPARFERERDQLERTLARWISGGVHHVGSTAVPGLAAKPTIDIMIGVAGLEAARACFTPLAALGYEYAPYRPDEMHWFCKPDLSRRLFHLHLVPAGSPRFVATLAFRDRLRADPVLAADYAILKRGLAERFAGDRDAYTAAKAEFVISASSPA